MKDNEVIKALECCRANNRCDTCPRLGMNCCMNLLMQNALDLINRQQAEIERLKQNIDGLNMFQKNHIKCIQSEAIKEFADRLLRYTYGETNNMIYLTKTQLKNLIKEMTEETE